MSGKDQPHRPTETPEHRDRRQETGGEPALSPVGPQGGAALSPLRKRPEHEKD
ncbi:hypothetical protein [Phenylobacterium sp.]|uniref:hypothetical protein n=1 Tax=Phenylobacterium sp. TaxID=1871053 RepID=UPI002BCA20B4|nr:hypothetical protein [Phenylobacterium sp.]